MNSSILKFGRAKKMYVLSAFTYASYINFSDAPLYLVFLCCELFIFVYQFLAQLSFENICIVIVSAVI